MDGDSLYLHLKRNLKFLTFEQWDRYYWLLNRANIDTVSKLLEALKPGYYGSTYNTELNKIFSQLKYPHLYNKSTSDWNNHNMGMTNVTRDYWNRDLYPEIYDRNNTDDFLSDHQKTSYDKKWNSPIYPTRVGNNSLMKRNEKFGDFPVSSVSPRTENKSNDYSVYDEYIESYGNAKKYVPTLPTKFQSNQDKGRNGHLGFSKQKNHLIQNHTSEYSSTNKEPKNLTYQTKYDQIEENAKLKDQYLKYDKYGVERRGLNPCSQNKGWTSKKKSVPTNDHNFESVSKSRYFDQFWDQDVLSENISHTKDGPKHQSRINDQPEPMESDDKNLESLYSDEDFERECRPKEKWEDLDLNGNSDLYSSEDDEWNLNSTYRL